MSPRTDPTTVAAGIGMASIFGFSFLFTKTALASLDLLDLLALRFLLAAAALIVLAAVGLVRVDLSHRRWRRLLPLAAVQPVSYFLCETTGVKLTSASEAGVIIGSIPVVVAVMACVFLRERPRALQVLFIICSSCGVALMVMGGGGLGRSHLGGLFFLLGAVLSAGVYSILSRRLSREFSPMEMTLAMMCVGAVVFGVCALANHVCAGTPFATAALGKSTVWLPLVYLGLLSSVAAFFLVNYMLSKMEAARMTAFTNLTSLVSLLAGVIILHENLHWYQLAGGALIVAGVWGTNRFARGAPIAAIVARPSPLAPPP